MLPVYQNNNIVLSAILGRTPTIEEYKTAVQAIPQQIRQTQERW